MTTTTFTTLLDAAGNVKPEHSLIWTSRFALANKPEGTITYKLTDDGLCTPCPLSVLPTHLVRHVQAGNIKPYKKSGDFKRFPINLVEGVPVENTSDKFKAKPFKATETVLTKTVVQQAPATRNSDIAALLAQCSSTIEELSQDLDEAQVAAYPLSHWAGSQWKATKAKRMLLEQGLIVQEGNGTKLTPKGQQHAIGVHSRSPFTKANTILYTSNVVPFIKGEDEPTPNKVSTVPFKVVSPEGEVMTVENVKQFSEKYGLIKCKLYCLANGSMASHKGFRLPE